MCPQQPHLGRCRWSHTWNTAARHLAFPRRRPGPQRGDLSTLTSLSHAPWWTEMSCWALLSQ